MSVTAKTLYDTDFVEWTAETAELLRQRRFEDIDIDNLIEEIADLGNGNRKAVRSQLRGMLLHLIKQVIQPEKDGPGWRGSLLDARSEIGLFTEDSPSLRRVLREAIPKAYRGAIKDALDETGLSGTPRTLGIPEVCPYSLEDLLEAELNKLSAKLKPADT